MWQLSMIPSWIDNRWRVGAWRSQPFTGSWVTINTGLFKSRTTRDQKTAIYTFRSTLDGLYHSTSGPAYAEYDSDVKEWSLVVYQVEGIQMKAKEFEKDHLIIHMREWVFEDWASSMLKVFDNLKVNTILDGNTA